MNSETKALNHSSCCSLFFLLNAEAARMACWLDREANVQLLCVCGWLMPIAVYPVMSAKGWGWGFKSFFHRKPYKNATGALTSSLLIEKHGISNILIMKTAIFQVLRTALSAFELLFKLLLSTSYPMQVFHCLNEILDLCHSFCSLVSQNLGPLDERGAAQLSILVKVNLCLYGPVLLPCKHLPKQSSWL